MHLGDTQTVGSAALSVGQLTATLSSHHSVLIRHSVHLTRQPVSSRALMCAACRLHLEGGEVSGMWLSLYGVRSATCWLAQVRGPSYNVGQSHFFSLPWTGSGFGILPHVQRAHTMYQPAQKLCGC
jgi:hypothetical protein